MQMDLLAGRLSGSKGLTVKGDVLVNGAPIDFAAFRKTAAYVQQQDHLPPTETVKECLMFSAQLRLPRSMSRAAKEARVDSILDELVRPSLSLCYASTANVCQTPEQRCDVLPCTAPEWIKSLTILQNSRQLEVVCQ